MILQAKPGRFDWHAIDKAMLEKSEGAIKPWEIGEWTLPEIDAFLSDPKDYGGMTDLEVEHRLKERAGWSNLQKLRKYEW